MDKFSILTSQRRVIRLKQIHQTTSLCKAALASGQTGRTELSLVSKILASVEITLCKKWFFDPLPVKKKQTPLMTKSFVGDTSVRYMYNENRVRMTPIHAIIGRNYRVEFSYIFQCKIQVSPTAWSPFTISTKRSLCAWWSGAALPGVIPAGSKTFPSTAPTSCSTTKPTFVSSTFSN